MSDPNLPFSPACERNKDAILAALRDALPDHSPAVPLRLLEVGSGSGQHAVHMVRHLAGVRWLASERAEGLPGLRARIRREGGEGLAPGSALEPPCCLDVTLGPWPRGPFDAVFTANTFHIVPIAAVGDLLRGAARVLGENGRLLVYGPFRYGDRHTAASNADFDAHLRSIDPAMGVRDAEAIARDAASLALDLLADQAMPANNRLLIFRRTGVTG